MKKEFPIKEFVAIFRIFEDWKQMIAAADPEVVYDRSQKFKMHLNVMG